MGHPELYGTYAPTRAELHALGVGLLGGAHADPAILAPCLMTPPADARMFGQFLEALRRHPDDDEQALRRVALRLLDSDAGRAARRLLAQGRAQVMNHYGLSKRLAHSMIPNRPAEAYLADATEFLTDILVQHHNTIGFFERYFGFSPEETAIFEQFVTHSLYALFAMGYPDAAHHASQVARLCVIKAAKNLATKPQLLQSALVGWIHDPKLDINLSIDNLSTHPVVASAIAAQILDNEALSAALGGYLAGQEMTADDFVIGVLGALSINNDSRFVAERFIFDQVALQLTQQWGDTKGVQLRETLWDRHQQRLAAPSIGELPQRFPSDLEAAITRTAMDSGLVGILQSAWLEICCQTPGTGVEDAAQADALYRQIVEGTCPDTPLVDTLSQALLSRQSHAHDALVFWPVNGLRLFSHHEEVAPSGRVAALALVNADPLLLSPHKVLEVRPRQEILMARLKSFIGSLDSNINDLPKDWRESALAWQRAVFIWILKTAQDLTGVDQLTRFHQSHRYTPVQSDVDELRRLILETPTWQDLAFLTMDNEPERQQFQKLIDAMRKRYLEMCRYYRESAMDPTVNETKIR